MKKEHCRSYVSYYITCFLICQGYWKDKQKTLPFLLDFVYLRKHSCRIRLFQHTIFANLLLCVQPCIFAKQGICFQSRCKFFFGFRVPAFPVRLHSFQCSHTFFESLSLLWVRIFHHLTKHRHHIVRSV